MYIFLKFGVQRVNIILTIVDSEMLVRIDIMHRQSLALITFCWEAVPRYSFERALFQRFIDYS